MKKILLCARDPGGANTVVPLVEKLKQRGYLPLLFGKDAALKQYRAYGLEGRDLAQEVPIMGEIEYTDFLRKTGPDFMITGTGSDDFTEKYLWKAAEILKIPCFAILDHWFNYGIRFSPYKLIEHALYKNDRRFPFLPTQIIVMDDSVRDAMIQEGFSADRIRVAGQPHFDTIREQACRFSANDRFQYRQTLGINETDFLVSFISENITEVEKGDDLKQYYWGYTERSIFLEVIESLRLLTQTTERRVHIVVKPHPNETYDAYSDLIATKVPDAITVSIDSTVHPIQLCKAADLVCGMSSMVLIEAVVLGLPVLSVQIGLTRENPFVLSQRGIIPSVLDRMELVRRMTGYLAGESVVAPNFEVIPGASERIIEAMEAWL